MRFHGVCGRLVAHPLHENRLPGDTLVRTPHRSSKSAGLETPVRNQKPALINRGAGWQNGACATGAGSMYQPPHFREERLDVQHDLIRAHPLGLLITSGPGGLMANPIPFLIDPGASPHGTLKCHMARANAQWRELDGLEECLVVFQGPQDYV